MPVADPGEIAKAFLNAGFKVTAFDASKKMVDCATELSGLSVLHMAFEDVNWTEKFDGIWACASLLHVSAEDFPAISEKFSCGPQN